MVSQDCKQGRSSEPLPNAGVNGALSDSSWLARVGRQFGGTSLSHQKRQEDHEKDEQTTQPQTLTGHPHPHIHSCSCVYIFLPTRASLECISSHTFQHAHLWTMTRMQQAPTCIKYAYEQTRTPGLTHSQPPAPIVGPL